MLILKGYNDKAGKTTKSNKLWFFNGFLCAFLMILMSCTHFAAKQQVLDKQVQTLKYEQIERASIYVKGASDTLHTIPTQDRTPETDLAEQLINYGSDLLPPVPVYLKLDISALLSENQKTRDLAEKSLNKMIEQDKLTAQKLDNVEKQLGKVEDRLINYGATFEQQRNKNIWTRMVASFGIFGTIGIIIALCILFPALIPVFIAILKWIINKFVTFITWLVPAMSNLVKGIGNFKKQLKTEVETNKSLPSDKQITYTPSEVLQYLNDELNKSTDVADKAVIEKLKVKLNI